jgi:hypothetical protein
MLAWLLHEAEHVAFFVGLVRASLLGAGLETVLQHAPANLMLSRTIAQQFVSCPHSSLFSHQLQPHPWCYALRNFKWAAVRCVPALCMTCLLAPSSTTCWLRGDGSVCFPVMQAAPCFLKRCLLWGCKHRCQAPFRLKAFRAARCDNTPGSILWSTAAATAAAACLYLR